MKFVIITPHYDPKSNGIVLLFELALLLEKAGANVFLFPHSAKDFFEYSHLIRADLRTKVILDREKLPAGVYCITPEVTPQNVIEATQELRRIWFFLNKPMVITTIALRIRPDDYIVCYSTMISRCYFNLFINQPLQTDLVPVNRAEKENLILFYVGKGKVEKAVYDQIARFVRKYKGFKFLAITRSNPKHKRDYYELIKKAKLLICFDPITNVIYESILHGTPVYRPYLKEHFDFENFNVSYAGTFTDFDSIEQWVDNGIPQDQVDKNLREYHQSITEGGMSKVLEFIEKSKNWFDVVDGKTSDRDSLRYFEDESARVRTLLGAHGVGANEVRFPTAEIVPLTALHAALHAHNENRLKLMHAEYDMLGSICANHLIKKKKTA